MTREMYRDVSVAVNTSVNRHIIGNIIERYKDNSDNNENYLDDSSDASAVLTRAQDGELIYGARALEKDDGWYLDFQNGKVDGPYQQIEYDAEYLYCTIIFGLAYRYELSGLLSGVGSQYGYYAYLRQFVEKHKEEYIKFKRANDFGNKYQRAALFESDYRAQRRRAYLRKRAYERTLQKFDSQQFSIA